MIKCGLCILGLIFLHYFSFLLQLAINTYPVDWKALQETKSHVNFYTTTSLNLMLFSPFSSDQSMFYWNVSRCVAGGVPADANISTTATITTMKGKQRQKKKEQLENALYFWSNGLSQRPQFSLSCGCFQSFLSVWGQLGLKLFSVFGSNCSIYLQLDKVAGNHYIKPQKEKPWDKLWFFPLFFILVFLVSL